MVSNILLLLSAVSSISFSAMDFQEASEHFDVYSEDCMQRYELIVRKNDSLLIDKTTENLVEAFSNGNNPYANADIYDYLVYANSKEECRYLGVRDNKLINLETGLAVTVEPTKNEDIYSALTGISASEIPSNAKMCKYSYYFKCLNADGFGKNEKGTCSLVAMQILFGYYDSVYDDNVVEEIYDSPVSQNAMTCAEFSKSPATKGEKFHSYLINYCNSYLKLSVENRGLSNVEQFNLINSYIGTSRNLKYIHNTSEGNVSDILSGKQFGVVKDAINAGRPAILNTLGHSMVAFGYDDNNVYLMSGWKDDRNISKMSWNDFNGNIFSNHCGAYDLTINSPHTCSNNYRSNILNKYICPKDGIYE